jgi:hypothetical protein
MEMWRYFPTAEEINDPNLHPYLRDGKWRWSPHDLEASWAPWGHPPANINTIDNILNGNMPNNPQWQGTSALLRAVLQRPEMRGRFANTLVDLIEGVCAPDNVNAVLSDLEGQIRNELRHAIGANVLWPVDQWNRPPEYTVSESSIINSRRSIRTFADQRQNFMLDFIGQPFTIANNSGLGFNRNNRHPVTLTTTEGGGAVMNSRPVAESQTEIGNYYNGTSVNITAKPYPGYAVSHWIANGIRIDTVNEITVEVDRARNVELHFSKDANANIYISEVKATAFNSQANDWVEIHNPTDSAISTRGIYLSESNSNFFKWQMPARTIRAGETVRFITNDNSADSALKRTRLGFNIGFGERLRLTDAAGNVLSFIEVPLMNDDETLIRQREGRYTVINHNPPPPPPPKLVPVRLMAQSAETWVRYESPVFNIVGNDTYTVTLNIFPRSHLTNLAVRTDGATFSHPGGFTNCTLAPTEWANARVNIESVTINGNSVGATLDSNANFLVSRRSVDSGGGNVNITLWDGWNQDHRRLAGVRSVDTGGSVSFGRLDNAPITSIVVRFTVSGIPN